MRFGFATDWSRSVDEVLSSVQHAELLGFDSAWIADLSLQRDVYVGLAACALKTKSIRLGTAVTNPYTRHPAVTAAAFATLNEISRGRTAIGLGIGSKKNLLDPLGIRRGQMPQILRETVNIIRELLSNKDQTSTYTGKFFKLCNAKLTFSSQYFTPIYVAGRGAGTLSVAGEVADGAMMSSLTTPEAINYAMAAIDHGAKEARRDPRLIERIVYARISMAKDERKAKENVRPLVPYRVWDDSFSTLQQIGYDQRLVTQIKGAYAKEDFETAMKLVTDRMLDDFAIAGTVDQCLEKVEKLKTLGVTQLIVNPVPSSYPERMQQLSEFSERIMTKMN